jgi:hypothetical protein
MELETRKLLDNQDWDTLIKKLTLHAYSRFKFWNLLRQRVVKGYSPEEVALEAISLVYSGEWNWDPSKSDLLTYLKFHVVNGLVANLARSKEVLTTDSDDRIDSEFDFSIEEDLNARMITESIRETLSEDLLVEIFDDLLQGMKRGDIIEAKGIPPDEYDNALKRLKARILKWNRMTIAK